MEQPHQAIAKGTGERTYDFEMCWRPNWTLDASILLALLGALALSQWFVGGYRNEFAGHEDKAAHYVTGVMFHDYFLAALHDASPVKFAQNFYIHYPKGGCHDYDLAFCQRGTIGFCAGRPGSRCGPSR